MSTTSVKRTIRFPIELAAALDRRATLDGLETAEFVRRVVEREINGGLAEAIFSELKSIREEFASVLNQQGEDQKSFSLEIVLALGERLTASNEALVRQLLGALPDTPSKPSSSHHELLPGLNLNT